jgi:hypothetical protein
MTQVLGDFIELEEGSGEYLKLGFHPRSVPLQQRWRNNGLSADFLADYVSTFFPADDEGSAGRKAEVKSAVSYIANELLENAMKFTYAKSHHVVTIQMFLQADDISLYATNSFNPETLESFQEFIQRLLTEDTDDMYMEQLERNAESESDESSGLGFLTMLNDYGASLSWRFSDSERTEDGIIVTTLVRLKV